MKKVTVNNLGGLSSVEAVFALGCGVALIFIGFFMAFQILNF